MTHDSCTVHKYYFLLSFLLISVFLLFFIFIFHFFFFYKTHPIHINTLIVLIIHGADIGSTVELNKIIYIRHSRVHVLSMLYVLWLKYSQCTFASEKLDFADICTPSKVYRRYTLCPRSSDPFYLVSCHIKWVTTSWTYGI